MSKKRLVLVAAVSLIIGVPLSWILAMSLTPLFWRLEPILHIELAGHSGPADWVFYLVFAVVVPSLFLMFKRALR